MAVFGSGGATITLGEDNNCDKEPCCEDATGPLFLELPHSADLAGTERAGERDNSTLKTCRKRRLTRRLSRWLKSLMAMSF